MLRFVNIRLLRKICNSREGLEASLGSSCKSTRSDPFTKVSAGGDADGLYN